MIYFVLSSPVTDRKPDAVWIFKLGIGTQQHCAICACSTAVLKSRLIRAGEEKLTVPSVDMTCNLPICDV